ncbi:transcription factor with AP2 domain related protein [Cyclospora cayetanensis]|uniref:Transcription factor with AP2 domain related protein n=1 Tax=Cyclospora cayetanensis TaxID=88456 RepID=A0A1D3DAI0_9EIME|nr:transcription factor with AP2 domain related protein [Cyclospora cayetanensis]
MLRRNSAAAAIAVATTEKLTLLRHQQQEESKEQEARLLLELQQAHNEFLALEQQQQEVQQLRERLAKYEALRGTTSFRGGLSGGDSKDLQEAKSKCSHVFSLLTQEDGHADAPEAAATAADPAAPPRAAFDPSGGATSLEHPQQEAKFLAADGVEGRGPILGALSTGAASAQPRGAALAVEEEEGAESAETADHGAPSGQSGLLPSLLRHESWSQRAPPQGKQPSGMRGGTAHGILAAPTDFCVDPAGALLEDSDVSPRYCHKGALACDSAMAAACLGAAAAPRAAPGPPACASQEGPLHAAPDGSAEWAAAAAAAAIGGSGACSNAPATLLRCSQTERTGRSRRLPGPHRSRVSFFPEEHEGLPRKCSVGAASAASAVASLAAGASSVAETLVTANADAMGERTLSSHHLAPGGGAPSVSDSDGGLGSAESLRLCAGTSGGLEELLASSRRLQQQQQCSALEEGCRGGSGYDGPGCLEGGGGGPQGPPSGGTSPTGPGGCMATGHGSFVGAPTSMSTSRVVTSLPGPGGGGPSRLESLPEELSEEMRPMKGVYFDRTQKSWIGSFYEERRQIKKRFKVATYGYHTAKALAINVRLGFERKARMRGDDSKEAHPAAHAERLLAGATEAALAAGEAGIDSNKEAQLRLLLHNTSEAAAEEDLDEAFRAAIRESRDPTSLFAQALDVSNTSLAFFHSAAAELQHTKQPPNPHLDSPPAGGVKAAAATTIVSKQKQQALRRWRGSSTTTGSPSAAAGRVSPVNSPSSTAATPTRNAVAAAGAGTVRQYERRDEGERAEPSPEEVSGGSWNRGYDEGEEPESLLEKAARGPPPPKAPCGSRKPLPHAPLRWTEEGASRDGNGCKRIPLTRASGEEGPCGRDAGTAVAEERDAALSERGSSEDPQQRSLLSGASSSPWPAQSQRKTDTAAAALCNSNSEAQGNASLGSRRTQQQLPAGASGVSSAQEEPPSMAWRGTDS